MQARVAAEIESKPAAAVTEDDKVAHRGYVTGAIMQATAALECEIWEVMVYGPGHHLGSNGIDSETSGSTAACTADDLRFTTSAGGSSQPESAEPSL
jgi:hypothetical protein